MKIMADPNSVRDRLVALEARVQRTEALLGQPLETPMVAIFQKFQDLEERVEKWGKSMDEIPSFIEGRMVSLAEDISILTDAVDMKLDAVNVEISVLKRATGSVVSGDGGPSSKLRVPDPKSFGGERSAKELENFLWDMETYFQVARVSDAEKVSMASMFLVGDAKLWWRSRVSDDVAANRGRIETWEALKKELKAQFLPCNSSWLARESLRNLRHTGAVRDYVNAFSSLMLDIREMSEEDKLFNFMAGLQGWAQAELRRQGVKDLPSAFATADSLVDFSGIEVRGSETKQRSTGNGAGNFTKGDSKNQETHDEKTPTSANKPRKGCFICGSLDHRMRDCPKRERLNALMADTNKDASESAEAARLGGLQVLNAIQILDEEDAVDPNSVRDRLVALEARVQRTEALLGQPLETPMVAIFQKFQDLEERVEKWGKSMDEIPSFIEGRMVSLAEDISILTDAVDMKLDAVNVEISVLKRATGSVVSGDGGPSSKLRVPDPKSFGGERSAKELENFLWDMETYFQVARVSDAEKVSMANLPSAFAAADSLVDFSGIEVRGSETKQRSTGNGAGNFTKGDSKNQETHDEKTPTSANKPRKGCFICGSLDHRMRDCPKRERLNALMADTNKDASESAEAARLGGLQVLNAIQILDEEDAIIHQSPT
ncbi:hypothetical protein BUALT_Bualt12G0120700 [Buddleja alternifolia]|uniref:CCHC-type domain-containing protein n=1 Tax=Buddleja alternifolia TaxID=168488 RepID=A0AAV6X1B4_9LAMI|nr:hypothetical protein BUALT_Bualt12G0120700 [Buddleja alternifolia]